MRTLATVVAVAAISFVFAGCQSVDVDAPVTMTITAEDPLNVYSEGDRQGSHSLDIYVFKVDDPDAFLGSDPSALRVTSADVTGGRSIGLWTVAPGQIDEAALGKVRDERWAHIGIFAAFQDPLGTSAARKRVIALTGDYELMLTVGARQITSFTCE